MFPTLNHGIIYPDIAKRTAEFVSNVQEGRERFIKDMARENAIAMGKKPSLSDEIIMALSSMCGNTMYNSFTPEDSMNDYIRDMIGQVENVRDQTRQGISSNSRHSENQRAGELDIQIRRDGKPICVYEGMKLESVVKNTIYDHIRKASVNYNPQGVKEVFVVAYVINQKNRFGDFWSRFETCVRDYNDDMYKFKWDGDNIDTGMSSIRCIHGFFDMDGEDHNVYVMAVKNSD